MKIPINEIKPNPNNPRVLKDWQYEKLKKSITEFPKMLELRPIVIDNEGIILGGNMRYRILKELNHKDVEVVKASELTEEEKKRFIIADNVSFGDWDDEVLANEWDVEVLSDWGLDLEFGDVKKEKEASTVDLSEQIKESFEVIIECIDEKQQQQVYEELLSKGYIVRVLTL